MFSLKNFCLKIIQVTSVLVLLSPLVAWNVSLFPFVVPKTVVFRILIEICFAAWVCLQMIDKQYKSPWKNPVIATAGIFLLASIFTSIFGLDWQRSFWSSAERSLGLLTQIHLFFWLVILVSVFKTWKQWQVLIFVSLGSGLVCALLAVWDVLRTHITQLRASATLGNATYLAIYLLYTMALTVFMYLRTTQRWLKQAFIATTVLSFFVILITGSRAPFYALIFCALLGAGVIFWQKRNSVSPSKAFVGLKFGLAGLAILFLALIFIRYYPGAASIRDKLPYQVSRVVVQPFGDPARVVLSKIGWRSFWQHPFLGWGQDNFIYAFTKNYAPGLPEPWADRTHNHLLDVLVFFGIVGFIAYVVFLHRVILLVWASFKSSMSSESNQLGVMALAAALLANFIVNLTLFDNLVGLIMFYFVIALLNFIHLENHLVAPPTESNIKPGQVYLVTAATSLAMILCVVYFNIIPFYKLALGSQGFDVSYSNLILGQEFFQKALKSHSFYNFEIRDFFQPMILDKSDYFTPDKKDLATWYIKEYEKNVAGQPGYLRNYIVLSFMYRFGAKFDPAYLAKDEDLLRRAMALSPKNENVYFELAEVYRLAGNQTLANEYLNKAKALNSRAIIVND